VVKKLALGFLPKVALNIIVNTCLALWNIGVLIVKGTTPALNAIPQVNIPVFMVAKVGVIVSIAL
jgi:hypothetical protein